MQALCAEDASESDEYTYGYRFAYAADILHWHIPIPQKVVYGSSLLRLCQQIRNGALLPLASATQRRHPFRVELIALVDLLMGRPFLSRLRRALGWAPFGHTTWPSRCPQQLMQGDARHVIQL